MSTTFKPFQEEHHIFRQQVRGFAENELAPKVDQWEEEELFPNSVFERAGELGILGAHYPEDVGGGGGDFWMSVVKSEELVRCGAAGVTMGLLVQADMATPVINDLGTREQKEEFLRTAEIIRIRDIPEGITRPQRATLTDGQLTHDAHIQTIDVSRSRFETPQGTELNFRDTYKHNSAAYLLDKVMDLGMVPVSVENANRSEWSVGASKTTCPVTIGGADSHGDQLSL